MNSYNSNKGIDNWKYRNSLYKWAPVPKLGKLIYGIGPGISFNESSQGITTGVGTIPIENGIRIDGKFLPNNIKMSLPSGMKEHEISHHLKRNDLFDLTKSSITGRYWKYNSPTVNSPTGISSIGKDKIEVQDDDPPEVLTPGKPDTTPDTNIGNLASFSPNKEKSTNTKYNPIKKAHPSDGMGSMINMLTEMAKKEIRNRAGMTSIKNIPQSHHEQRIFRKEINMKELPITRNTPSSEIPVNSVMLRNNNLSNRNNNLSNRNKSPEIRDKFNLSEDSRSYKDSKISEDHRKLKFDRNQVMIDNDKVPININLSCNNLGSIPHSNERVSHGFSGYGTPNLCLSHTNYPPKVQRVQMGQHQTLHNPILGDHGYSTLQNYYDSMSAGNNVHKLARRWRNRDYHQYSFSNEFHEPIKFSKHTATKQNTIGQPFAPFMTQHQVNHPIYEDKSKFI